MAGFQLSIELATNLTKIVNGLLARIILLQNKDGGWGEHRDQSDVFCTYLSIWALCEANLSATECCKKAICKLKKSRTSTGCWGKHFGSQGSIDSTARGLLSLLRCQKIDGHLNLLKDDHKALTFVLDRQNQDGSWSRLPTEDFYGSTNVMVYNEGDVGATLPIIDLLSMIPANQRPQKWEESLNKALDWVVSLRQADGGCSHTTTNDSDVLATAWALRALCNGNRNQDCKVIQSYAQYIIDRQSPYGYWSDKFKTNKTKGSFLYTYNSLHSLILSGKVLTDLEIFKASEWFSTAVKYHGHGVLPAHSEGSIQYICSIAIVLCKALKSDYSASILLDLTGVFLSRNIIMGSRNLVVVNEKHNIYASKAIIIIVAVLIALVVILSAPYIFDMWSNLQSNTQNIIIGGVIGILTSVIGAVVYDRIKKPHQESSK